jgi:DNA-binding MarR family transcriptional regulator/catechol 2,3-dioxygenase-like lactoylglutathione lyase family enzyme
MTESEARYYATPTLIRAARGTYARSMRAQLHAIGVDDLPRNGLFLLAGIASAGADRQDMTAELGITKQAVSQLIDTLVSRGYVSRQPDPDDGRRIALTLTERGEQVLQTAAEGVEAVDAQLRDRVGAEQIESMRSALRALAEIKAADTASGAGLARPARQFQQFSPIFPVRDLAAALDHYAALGFSTIAYADGADYGFANRDGLSLHLAGHHGHDLSDHGGSAAYLYVRDADALYAEWSRPGIGGRTTTVEPTPYKLREGSHTDPDGNLIRFGSPMAA